MIYPHRRILLTLGSVASLALLSNCGFLVGFEPRPCDDCEADSVPSGTGNGGSGNTSSSGGASGETASSAGNTSAGTTRGDAGGGGSSAGSMQSAAGAGPGGAGAESPCHAEVAAEITEAGSYPSQVSFGHGGLRTWYVAWSSNDTAYFYSFAMGTNTSLTASPGTLTPPVIATWNEVAAVAFGEFTSTPSLAFRRVQVLDPAIQQAASLATGGAAAPLASGATRLGNSERFLVTAIEADGSGLLGYFDSGSLVTSLALPGAFESLSVGWLGQRAVLFASQAGVLSLTLVTIEDDELGLAAPSTVGSTGRPEQPLRVANLESGAVFVWADTDRIMLGSVDADGTAGSPITAANGSNLILPNVTTRPGRVVLSWIDMAAGALMLRRRLDDTWEAPIEVASGVSDDVYGIAADVLSSEAETYALSYGTDRLQLSLVDCPP